MTDTLSDKIVEAAARALALRSCVNFDRLPRESNRDIWRKDARAALTAVAPLIAAAEREKVAGELDALAGVLEGFAEEPSWPKAQRAAYANQADTFRMKAAAIRARGAA
jgi:hypothetical protein